MRRVEWEFDFDVTDENAGALAILWGIDPDRVESRADFVAILEEARSDDV